MANTFNVANAVVNLDAGTAEFTLKMAQAGATVKNFGADGEAAANRVKAAMHGIVPEQIAASAAIRSLEGNPGIRAAERFLTTTLGLRGAISAAFPVIGALAFADVLVTMRDRARAFYKEVTESAARAKLAFGELASDSRVANDAMATSNARLENEIAKLTGKRENGLKVVLLEAKEAADSLGKSLEKDLDSLVKLIKEKEIGLIGGFVTGRQNTEDLEKPAERLQRRIGDIRSDTQDKTEGLTDPKQVAAVRREANQQIIKAIEDTENEYNLELDKIAQARAEAAKRREAALNRASAAPSVAARTGRTQTPLPGDQIAETEDRRLQVTGTLRNLRDLRNSVNLQSTHDDLTETRDAAKANESNEKLTKPYDAAIASLKGKIAEVNTLIAAAGTSDAAKVIAKGIGEAAKEQEHLNELLKKGNQLTDPQKAEITKLNVLFAQGQARDKLLNQADSEVKKNLESAASQRLIADSIGKSYEAARSAAVQIQVLTKLGESANSGEPTIVATRRRIESSAGAAFDAEHNAQAQNSILLLRQQAEANEAETLAVSKGAAAVRFAIEIEKEAELVRTQGTIGNAASAARVAFLAGETKDSAARTQALLQEAAEIRTLAAAYVQGADAIKDAQLKIEQAKIQRNTATGVDAKPEVTAAGDKDRAQRQGEIAKSAGESVNHFKDQLDALDKQRAAIQAMVVTEQNRVGIAIALKQIYDEQNRIIREQVLAVGSAADGARQFLRDLVTDSQSAASKINELFKSAYDGVNTNLAKLLTGQKTSWASFLKGLGEAGVKNQLQQLEKGIAGSVLGGGAARPGGGNGPWSEKLPAGIGSIFGLGKRDGSTPTTALYVSPVSLTGGVGGALGTLTKGGGGSDDSDDSAGNIFSKIFKGLFGGFHADGGTADADRISVVGERGPELFIPRSAGTVVPNGAIRGGGSGGNTSVTNQFIAIGEDPAAVQRASSRAMVATHNASVANAVRVINDRSSRTPQR